jgi:hypothetical protein
VRPRLGGTVPSRLAHPGPTKKSDAVSSFAAEGARSRDACAAGLNPFAIRPELFRPGRVDRPTTLVLLGRAVSVAGLPAVELDSRPQTRRHRPSGAAGRIADSGLRLDGYATRYDDDDGPTTRASGDWELEGIGQVAAHAADVWAGVSARPDRRRTGPLR